MSIHNKPVSALLYPATPLSVRSKEAAPSAPLDANACATTLGELMAALAHDAKQPLSAIGAEAAACKNWLTERPGDVTRVLASLGAMADDARRASELIDRVHALLAPTPSHGVHGLDALVETALDAVHGRLHARGLELTRALAAPDVRVRADSEQLQQVAQRLVLIAADACDQVPLERPSLRVSTHAHSHPARVSVLIEHTGRPILDTPLPLMELSPSSSAAAAGLSLCRSIVERHGGRLQLVRTPRADALGFTLPVA